MGKFLALINGALEEVIAIAVSAGAADASKLLKTDSQGRIDVSFLPVGVGPKGFMVTAGEAFAAGNYVNVRAMDISGTDELRAFKADNSNGRTSDGFTIAAAASGATFFFYESTEFNTAAPAGNIGDIAFLGTSGGVITTALDNNDNSNNGKVHQYLGKYITTTTIMGKDHQPVKIVAE